MARVAGGGRAARRMRHRELRRKPFRPELVPYRNRRISTLRAISNRTNLSFATVWQRRRPCVDRAALARKRQASDAAMVRAVCRFVDGGPRARPT